MGSSLSTQTEPQVKTSNENSNANAPQKEREILKNSYYKLPETVYDNHPVLSDEETLRILSEIPRIQLSSLFSEENFSEAAQVLTQQLQEEGFFIIDCSPGGGDPERESLFEKLGQNLSEVTQEFFSLPKPEKERLGGPGRVEGTRAFYSGYSEIHFPNNDNIRDEERRDVFQVRKGESVIPSPNPQFTSVVSEFYDFQWHLSFRILRAISQTLKIDFKQFIKIVCQPPKDQPNSELDEEKTLELINHPESSENTNFCLFRYWDSFGYTTEQKCMVHTDRGLVTVLSNFSLPGLYTLSYKHKAYLPIDKHLDKNSLLVFCGSAMQFVTNGHIHAQVHRVVRLPEKIRYSYPFEIQPFSAARLTRFLPPKQSTSEEETTDHHFCDDWFITELNVTDGEDDYEFGRLTKQMDWQVIQRKVNRADGLWEEIESHYKPNRQALRKNTGSADVEPGENFSQDRSFLGTDME